MRVLEVEAGILRSPCSGSSTEQVLNHCVSGGREKKNAESERANAEWRKEGRDESMKRGCVFPN